MSKDWSNEHLERVKEIESFSEELKDMKIDENNQEESFNRLVTIADRVLEIIQSDLTEVREDDNE